MPNGEMPDDERRRVFRLSVGAKRVEHDVDAEIEFHLAMRAQKLAAGGLAPEHAQAEALRQFGDLSAVRRECLTIDRGRERAMRRAIRFDDLRQDAAYALRTLRQRKGYAAALLLILAFGIGANTATFTLVDALLLRSLPVPNADQLVGVGNQARTGSLSQGTPRSDFYSYPLYADIRNGNHVFSGLYATGRAGRLDVLVDERGASADREPEHPKGRFVSGNYWSVLQVPAFAGRTFTAAEDRVPAGDPVAVISHGYWQRRFAGARTAIGQTIRVNGTPLTIIGVAPPGFTGDIVGQPIELWIPLMMQPALMPHSPWLEKRDVSWLLLMGRLAPGVTLPQARAAIGAIAKQSLLDHAPGDDVGGVKRAIAEDGVPVDAGGRGFSYYRRSYAPALYILSAAVGLVLLVVCANVANLMLARATTRGREMSVRMAIGAGRLRLIQQLLVESLVLSLAGAALGLLFAAWGSSALLKLASAGPTPIPVDARIDGRVLAYTAAIAIGTAMLFGLAPALHATRVQLATVLRGQGRGVTGSSRGGGKLPLGKLLVVAQVALSTLLLVSTGMLVRSTQRLEHADLGLARSELLIAGVDAGRAGYTGARLAALTRDLIARVERVPGVRSATMSENGIFSGTESGTSLQVESFRARADTDTLVSYDDVGPKYFATIGGHLLRGRDFEARDDEGAPKVAVVNETMARFYFPGAEALGRHVSIDSATYEIIGVVADVQGQGVREPPVRRLYMPAVQMKQPPEAFRIEVRVVGDPERLVEPVRRALRAADPALAISSVDPLDALVRDAISQDRLVAQVVTFFGALALVLAALGLYGVMAYATLRRTSEFGLRMALGADRAAVTRLVVREAMALVAIGAVFGVPAALGATRLLRNQLFGIGMLDLPSIAIAVGVLVASGAVAAYLPALRAARVAPLEALRAD